MKVAALPDLVTGRPVSDAAVLDVLVVGDRSEDLGAVERALDDADVRVLGARTWRDAVPELGRDGVGIVLVAPDLPGLDRCEVASIVAQRTRTRRVPLLFDYLARPIDPDVVRAKLAVAVDLAAQDRRIREQAEQLRCAERRHRELADELAFAHQRARDAVDLRDEFLSIASHELRTPLSAMMLGLESMRVDLDRGADGAGTARGIDVPRLTGRLDRSLRQAVRLNRLVADLLDVSRIVSGRLALDLGDCCAGELTRAVVDRHADDAARAGCQVECVAAAAPGRWDRRRLEQVVTNLLANAIKYAAGAPIAVRVHAGDRVRIAVEDAGPGIAPADLARIFGRFERAASARHYGGLGIGLFIAQQIVHAHGGRIAVASRPGHGSLFTVELPAVASPS